jgi:hypothetical protein
MKLIIGCPIYDRDWIFPYWISCIQSQSVSLSDIGFVFVASKDDQATIHHLEQWRDHHPEVKVFDILYPENVNHFSHKEGTRQWTLSKYENMVNLRNILLQKVREYNPDYFFSLDSDILIKNPSTIELLIAHIKEGADAVNPLMYMTPVGTSYPSVMKWVAHAGGKAHRDLDFPIGTYFKSDVIMAAKMMSRKVYSAIDYAMHPQGEDLGWSTAAADHGFNLYCASYIYTPHIMSRAMLQDVLRNGDPREFETLKTLSKV